MANADENAWNADVRGTQVLPLINSNDRIIRVEAGPGTGKTFGLGRRIQRIVHPDGLAVDGVEVLVVAFNRVIAQQLNAEVEEILKSSPHTNKPAIKTIHALCLQAIGEDIRLLLPHEREAMLYDVLEEHPKLADELDFRAAEQALRDHEANHKRNMTLWQAVDRWLNRHECRLISDLPGLLLDKLKGGDLGGHRFLHIVVDEFQDLTPGEQELVVLLLKSDGSMVALGDPRQSIYAFRGNDREGLSKLSALLKVDPAAITDVPMTECQRCPEAIVSAANQLMSLYPAASMIAKGELAANIHVVVWDTPQHEARGMARAIVANFRAHPNDRHLVMVPRRQFGYMLRDEIAALANDIPVDLSFSEGLLETWAVREAFLFFCLVVDPDAATWRAWFGYQNSDDGKNYKASKRNAAAYLDTFTAHGDKLSSETINEIVDDPSIVKKAGAKNLVERATRYAELLDNLDHEQKSSEEIIDYIFDDALWTTGKMEDAVTARQDMALLRTAANSLLSDYVDEDGDVSPLDVLRRVARSLRYHIAVREPVAESHNAVIRVTTLWSAKGVTAEHVYLLGLCDEAIPGNKRAEYPGTDDDFREEQRRLFYVSLTRSKRTMVLSRAQRMKGFEAARMGLYDGGKPPHWVNLSICPFLRAIINYVPRALDGENWNGC